MTSDTSNTFEHKINTNACVCACVRVKENARGRGVRLIKRNVLSVEFI